MKIKLKGLITITIPTQVEEYSYEDTIEAIEESMTRHLQKTQRKQEAIKPHQGLYFDL
ncbi:MAG: hypothetical protein U0L85_10795 [Bacilli bacterium]|nr:hypothetical protein [Bacilli bacterium]